jgi:hypothetical protein
MSAPHDHLRRTGRRPAVEGSGVFADCSSWRGGAPSGRPSLSRASWLRDDLALAVVAAGAADMVRISSPQWRIRHRPRPSGHGANVMLRRDLLTFF